MQLSRNYILLFPYCQTMSLTSQNSSAGQKHPSMIQSRLRADRRMERTVEVSGWWSSYCPSSSTIPRTCALVVRKGTVECRFPAKKEKRQRGTNYSPRTPRGNNEGHLAPFVWWKWGKLRVPCEYACWNFHFSLFLYGWV